MAWNDLEHAVWKSLKNCGLDAKDRFFLCISGGLDSMVLLHVFTRIKPQAQLTIAHFHHGPSDSPQQADHRDQCLKLIEDACARFQLPNLTLIKEQNKTALHSEAEFRQARWKFFNKHRQQDEPIITAHHLDDWIETLTLKLIRGVGAEGFTAMKIWDENIFRPFLETSKSDLLAYANAKDLLWSDDPSNDSSQYLRNWLRNEWFKSLDEKNPSGYENYSRSLLRLCQELNQNQTLDLCFYSNNSEFGLDRLWYFSLSDWQQKKAISLYLRHHRIPNTTQGQIAEIQKRLGNDQKDFTFSVGPIKLLLNANQIMLQF